MARALEGAAARSLTLFDVGTGAADLPRDAEQWGRRRGFVIRGMGIDRNYAAARVARANGVATVVGCAGTLPLGDRSVDLVLVSQVIHHLTLPAVIQLLAECGRVAKRAVIVCDLRRARLAEAGFWLGSRVLGFDAATRADGITSVRRGYSVAEFRRSHDGRGPAGAGVGPTGLPAGRGLAPRLMRTVDRLVMRAPVGPGVRRRP